MIGSIGMTSRKLTTIVDRHADADVGGGDRAAVDEPGHEPDATPAASDRRAVAPRDRPTPRPPPDAPRARDTARVAELALDPQQPVVLGDALGARRRARS